MELQDVFSPLTNKIANAYVNRDEQVSSFFDYPDIQNENTYKERVEELRHRAFPREELVNYLLEFHEKYNVSERTVENINKMRDPKSVVVIGGQQAGLLTGPLYTIHKIISIIKFAKEQESLLDVPVLPVFWIAGEDHDFAEINHAFVLRDGRVEKRAIKQKNLSKIPASALELDKEKAQEWIKDLVSTFGETTYTKMLLNDLNEDADSSTTYVDFFLRIIFRLFKEQGLIVVDSGDHGFRKVGSSFIQEIIRKNGLLGENVLRSQSTLLELGFGQPIEINENNAHLFYLQNSERILLERDKTQFVGKNNECRFLEEELLEAAKIQPELISNNVVTRPLMQEYVFPTLAFISGPGEIAYWATLKEAFHLFGFKVPPLVPRLMMSIIDRKTAKYMEELGLDLAQTIQNGCGKEKEKWLKEQQPYPIDECMEETLTGILKAHLPFKELASVIDDSLKEIAEKNAAIIESQIYFLKQKMEKTIAIKNQVQLAKFDHINHCLKPLHAPQERIWNVYYYINKYGYEWIDELLNLEYRWNHQHKAIFI